MLLLVLMRIQPWMQEKWFPLVAVGLLFLAALVLPAFLAIIPQLSLVALATGGVLVVLRLDERCSSPVVKWAIAIATIMVANVLVAVLAILSTWLVLLGLPLCLVLAWQGARELVRRWPPGGWSPFPTAPRPPVSGTSSYSSSRGGAPGGACPVQGKVTFANATEAQQAVQRSLDRHQRGESRYEEPLRGSYRCSSCGGWHVSRQG